MSKKMNAKETKTVSSFYGSKSDWVKFEFPYPEVNMKNLFDNAFNGKAVVCEDEQGLYITGKSYINSNILDPYRMYHRRKPKVNSDGIYSVE